MTEKRTQLEWRRQTAIALFKQGVKQTHVAGALAVSRTTASRWWNAWKGGSDLKSRKATGRPVRLKPDSVEMLTKLIEQDPNLKVRQLQTWISNRFGIVYHLDHLYRMKKKIIDRMKARS